jgi:hypothetical protein
MSAFDPKRRIAVNIAKLRAVAECLIAALQFCGSVAVSIRNALNRVIASRTGKNL